MPNIHELLQQLGLSNAKHWDKVSRTTRIFEVPGGPLVYLKESEVAGRGGFWGLGKDKIDQLKTEGVPWKAVLANVARRSGYVIEGEMLLDILRSKTVAQDGDYKFYEDSPELRPLQKMSLHEIRDSFLGRPSPSRTGSPWTREDEILSLSLYKATGPSHDASDPEVQDVALLLQRTPDSIAQKMANFRAVETEGRHGLRNFTSLDRAVWKEFEGREDELYREAEKLRNDICSRSKEIDEAQVRKDERRILSGEKVPTERRSETRVRQQTQALRRIVLTDYDWKCAFCDVDIPELLHVSHVRSWKDDEESRLRPSNTICLCLLHHGAFDYGFLTVLRDGRIRASSRVRASSSSTVESMLTQLDGNQMRTPHKFPPNPEFLARHSKNVFKDA